MGRSWTRSVAQQPLSRDHGAVFHGEHGQCVASSPIGNGTGPCSCECHQDKKISRRVTAVSQSAAQAVFDAVKKQFKSWLDAGDAGPTLLADWDWIGGYPAPFAIVWEGGPYNWVDYVPVVGVKKSSASRSSPLHPHVGVL